MPLAHLPAEWVGRRIIQLSDIHVGSVVDMNYLRGAIDGVVRLEPALTVITGDFMTCDAAERIGDVERLMARLNPGPLGAYAVLGNHDYGENWRRSDVADRLASRLTEAGVSVLRNQQANVNGLQLVGLDDLWSRQFDASAIVPRVDWNLPTITLCHNPDGVDHPDMQPVRGWILSGHTHGGQCKPPFLPPPRLPVINKRYTSGEFSIRDDCRLYINRGLGYLRRVRFNVRPEVTVFTLSKA